MKTSSIVHVLFLPSPKTWGNRLKSFHYKTTNIALLSLIDHYCIKLLMVFQSHFWKLTLLSNQTFKLHFYVKYFSFKIKMEDLPLGYIRSNLVLMIILLTRPCFRCISILPRYSTSYSNWMCHYNGAWESF